MKLVEAIDRDIRKTMADPKKWWAIERYDMTQYYIEVLILKRRADEYHPVLEDVEDD